MQREPKKSNFVVLVIIAVSIILLTYTGYDAFKVKPELNQKVDTVVVHFDNLRSYLNTKLPEMDSLLILHTHQIQEQNKQLNELNTLTEVLKETK